MEKSDFEILNDMFMRAEVVFRREGSGEASGHEVYDAAGHGNVGSPGMATFLFDKDGKLKDVGGWD